MDPNDPTAQLEEELDSDISSIRREICKLQRRRRFLSSSILSSEALQKSIKPQPSPVSSLLSLNKDISPLVRTAGTHAQSNHHRIAFSVTTFPFKDPSPTIDAESEDLKNLLGVRIDICVRNGRFTKPYYLLLRKARTNEQSQGKVRVKVHRHTIPAFIPVERLGRVFLPDAPQVLGDGDGNAETQTQLKRKPNTPPRKQNLNGFVREVRRQLVAWHTRLDAVYLLREQLGIIRRGVDAYPDEEEDGPWDRDVLVDVDFDSGVGETRLKENKLAIVAISPTALEASYVRVEWVDGRVGRFKISNSGMVERAVVIGDGGRDKILEAVLTGGDGKVLTVLERLKKVAFLRDPE
ncbi:Cenp-O kinetochore centromere component-domain-containing protein [Aspergillus cavernicola]|uniref:Cenp-O kinetochore centromere component-domain-containing protein n=1 Tax=Aspergillus cavernicola TaxID=176166 RepID=A0ABR4ITM6_9EURO